MLFFFCSHIKCRFSGLNSKNACQNSKQGDPDQTALSKNVCQQIGKTLIRLLVQKQSDHGLLCLSRPFCQATSVQNFRTYFLS